MSHIYIYIYMWHKHVHVNGACNMNLFDHTLQTCWRATWRVTCHLVFVLVSHVSLKIKAWTKGSRASVDTDYLWRCVLFLQQRHVRSALLLAEHADTRQKAVWNSLAPTKSAKVSHRRSSEALLWSKVLLQVHRTAPTYPTNLIHIVTLLL